MKVKISLQYLKTLHLCYNWCLVISAFTKKIIKLWLIFFSICFFLLQATLNEVRWVSSGFSEYINGLWKICFLKNNLTHIKICHMYFGRYTRIIFFCEEITWIKGTSEVIDSPHLLTELRKQNKQDQFMWHSHSTHRLLWQQWMQLTCQRATLPFGIFWTISRKANTESNYCIEKFFQELKLNKSYKVKIRPNN